MAVAQTIYYTMKFAPSIFHKIIPLTTNLNDRAGFPTAEQCSFGLMSYLVLLNITVVLSHSPLLATPTYIAII
ncbi:hypothetical protein B0H19DRAFT_1276585 [Mycena capillaripes]|nr:hypothetical protein B0H19DRAFT_1276585 [Mycena capillaripes]